MPRERHRAEVAAFERELLGGERKQLAAGVRPIEAAAEGHRACWRFEEEPVPDILGVRAGGGQQHGEKRDAEPHERTRDHQSTSDALPAVHSSVCGAPAMKSSDLTLPRAAVVRDRRTG
jgi:hypothetical protein